MKTVSYHKQFFLSVAFVTAVADLDGFLEVSIEPPFHFHGEFSKKSGKINKYYKSGKINKSNPLCKVEPPIKESWEWIHPLNGF